MFKVASFVMVDGYQMGLKNKLYEDEEMEKLKEEMSPATDSAYARVLGLDEDLRSDSLFEDIFGDKKKIHREYFLSRLEGQARWVFNASSIREKVFKETGVPMKHLK